MARAAYGRYYMPLSLEFLQAVRPRHAPREPDLPDLRGRALERGRHQRRRVHRHRPRRVNAARQVHGLTPISEEQQTIDHSWTLNVADNVKDQHTDQFTLNFEREIAQNFSVARDLHLQAHDRPVRQHPHQPGDGPGVGVRADTVHDVRRPERAALQHRAQGLRRERRGRRRRRRVDRRQQHLQGPEHAGLRRHQAQARLPRAPARLPKRYSDRWQALASFLYSNSAGIGRRTLRQDFNVEGPMFWDDNWMGTLNYTINNLEGPLPFTPKYEVKLSGSYTVPRLEVDLGARLRIHTGRPIWQAGGLSPAHPVRRSAGRRDRPRWARPDRRRGSQQPDYLPSLDPPRSPSREGLQARRKRGSCISSSTGSTSSTPTRPPTSTSTTKGTARWTSSPRAGGSGSAPASSSEAVATAPPIPPPRMGGGPLRPGRPRAQCSSRAWSGIGVVRESSAYFRASSTSPRRA